MDPLGGGGVKEWVGGWVGGWVGYVHFWAVLANGPPGLGVLFGEGLGSARGF